MYGILMHTLNLAILLSLAVALPFEAVAFDHSANVLKILTFNIAAPQLDAERLRQQIAQIRTLDPDIICLQEVWSNTVREAYFHAFPEYVGYTTYERSVGSWKREIMETISFGPDDEIARGSAQGLVTLLKQGSEKYSAYEVESGIFKNQFALTWITQQVEAVMPKGYLATRYHLPKGAVQIVNTHLSNGETNPGRMKQVKELVDHATRIAGGDPIILCGDTNSDGEREKDMTWLHTEAGFKDSFRIVYPDVTQSPHKGATWDNANPMVQKWYNEVFLGEGNQRVDYVSYRSSSGFNFRTHSSKIVFDSEIISDHYGIYSILELTQNH